MAAFTPPKNTEKPRQRPIIYVVSWFPMFSESFIYNELRAITAQGCPIDTILVLHRRHDPVDADLAGMRVVYPPTTPAMLRALLCLFLCHPLKACWLISYLARIHRRDLLTMQRGTTSFIKSLLLLPMIAWFHRHLGQGPFHLHAHSTTIPTTIAMALAHLSGSSYSLTGHGSDVLLYGPHSISRRVAEARFMITVSQYNKDFLCDHHADIAAEKIHVIPAGINTAAFACQRTATDLQQAPTIRILTVARLSPEKGHAPFLEALAQLAADGIRFKYDLIGDGHLRDELTSLVESLGLSPHVQFHGFQNPPFIRHALAEAHLFVLTSRSEGFPVVLMEAAAAGLPVLATRITGIPEIIHDNQNGVLVEPDDVAGMLAALRRLAADDWQALHTLYCTALAQDVSCFDEATTSASIAKLLQQAATETA